MFVDRTDAFKELHERIKLYHDHMSEFRATGRLLSASDRSAMRAATEHLRVTSPDHKRSQEMSSRRLSAS